MRDQIGLATLVNWVAMLRADVDGAILLADDDNDGKFYERVLHSSARMVPSPSMAMELLIAAQERGVSGVAAALNGRSLTNTHHSTFQPGLGDTSAILLANCANDVLGEVAGGSWLRACEKEIGSVLIRAAAVANSVRKLQENSGVPITIDQILSAIDWSNFSLSEAKLTELFSADAVTNANAFLNANSPRSLPDLFAGCDGFAVVSVLAAATKNFMPRGLAAQSSCSTSELLGMLRVSFSKEKLETDVIFWQMRRWEMRNPKFPLLSQWRALDPLQTVWDQRYWESDLSALLAHDFEHEGLTGLKLDLDNFKNVNEVLGHGGGDDAIRLTGKILNRVVAGHGEVYRRGGDEFVILAPGIRGSAAAKLAEAIRVEIESQFAAWSVQKHLAKAPTASIGYVDADAECGPDELIRLMDEAQGRAKHEGKNRVVGIAYVGAEANP
ncbi:GGDEF domain-containing protein [Paraburkholderia kururiensis]|uniref:GGDEF domain-containing protein n=1 Tax=Paraburkholderia kururiensis TaxID=984307 RepID=UPI00034B0186|nr:GGDEF domain-containing protein [Paraburkholderia kururiensis]